VEHGIAARKDPVKQCNAKPVPGRAPNSSPTVSRTAHIVDEELEEALKSFRQAETLGVRKRPNPHSLLRRGRGRLNLGSHKWMASPTFSIAAPQSWMSGTPVHVAVPQYRRGLDALRQFFELCVLGLSQQNPLGSMFELTVLAARLPSGPGG